MHSRRGLRNQWLTRALKNPGHRLRAGCTVGQNTGTMASSKNCRDQDGDPPANGAVLVYLLIAVGFACIFTFLGLSIDGAFKGIEFEDDRSLASKVFYLSFATLTSTGYGDIVPVHPWARSLCNIEAVIGQLYPATLLARLVTLELGEQNQHIDRRYAAKRSTFLSVGTMNVGTIVIGSSFEQA